MSSVYNYFDRPQPKTNLRLNRWIDTEKRRRKQRYRNLLVQSRQWVDWIWWSGLKKAWLAQHLQHFAYNFCRVHFYSNLFHINIMVAIALYIHVNVYRRIYKYSLKSPLAGWAIWPIWLMAKSVLDLSRIGSPPIRSDLFSTTHTTCIPFHIYYLHYTYFKNIAFGYI